MPNGIKQQVPGVTEKGPADATDLGETSLAQVNPRDEQPGELSAEIRPREGIFLSTLPASRGDWRVASAVVIVSLIVFVIAVPFAQAPLLRLDAFIPVYQATLAVGDLITAVMLFGQYSILRSASLRMLASGYLFTTLMIVVHTLSFPGVFAPTGLLGAGPQTTAWLYMFWHGGFPLFVLAYVWLRKVEVNAVDLVGANSTGVFSVRPARAVILPAVAGVLAAVIVFTLLVTLGQDLLPAVMAGNRYSSTQIAVISVVWLLCFGALLALWRQRQRSVLDIWLMVVMCAWLLDMALGAVLNNARYDLGWYAGRIYGLMATSFVLMVLLLEIRALYARQIRLIEAERIAAESRAAELREANRALRDSQDQLSGLNETLEERVRAGVLQLDAAERRHRDLVDLMQEAIWVHVDGKIVFANPAAARFFGADQTGALIGQPTFARIHPDDRERAAVQIARLLATPSAAPVSELRLLTLNDKVRIAAVHAVSFLQDGRMHVMVSALDSTALRDAETQLLQAQKMESVGQLTGGIAHDFNNLLTVIIGGLDIVVGDMQGDNRPLVEASLRAAERGASLVKQMLAFSRRQVLAPESIDLGELSVGMEDLLRRTLGEEIEIDMQRFPGLWRAAADKGQVESALLNLAINARDAMPSGGKLTIETGNAHLDADYAKANAEVAPGDYVMLAVTDTGTGMLPEVIQRAFEPFFTTKAVGKGSGLGLSMIYGFAKQSGGHLKIYSEVGHGTTIRLYLPRQVMEGAGPEAAATSATGAIHRAPGGETILVVEDNTLVRDLVTRQLRDLGYNILEAADGPAARVILESDAAIDLLFTDVVLPGGLTGRQLAEGAKQLRPGLKTLYASGYTQNSIIHQGKLDPGVHFLSKPFRRQELAQKVRQTLDATA